MHSGPVQLHVPVPENWAVGRGVFGDWIRLPQTTTADAIGRWAWSLGPQPFRRPYRMRFRVSWLIRGVA